MRLVLDQGIPRDAAGLFHNLGLDCLHVGEIGMHKAADEEILRWTLTQRGVVVTLDADFHAILAVTRASAPSVIRLRTQGLDAGDVVEQVQRVLGRFESELQCGCLVTVKARKITCHTLPVGGGD